MIEGLTQPAASAVIYARYSSDRQNPVSCAQQIEQCRRWAASQVPPWDILETFQDDAISGTLGREGRSGFDQLLAFVEQDRLPRGGAVLVFELDRFSREYTTGMIEMLRLAQRGVHLADTSSGLLNQDDMAGQLRAFLGFLTASDWVKKHSSHVRRGIRSRVEQGYFFGKAPFGYRRVKADGGPTLEADPDEAPHLVKMFELAAAGRSAASIARQMDHRAVRTRTGSRWRASTVRDILCNPTYTGKVVQYATAPGPRRSRYATPSDQITVYPGRHPALVDEPTAALVRRQFTPGSQDSRTPPRKYPLSGLLRCADCGRAATIVRHSPRSYRCHDYGSTDPCTNGRLVRLSDAEDAVRAWALRLANDRRALDLAAREAVMIEWEQAQQRAESRAPIEAEIADLERQVTATFKLAEAGNAPALVNRRLAELETRLDAARDRLQDVGEAVDPIPVEVAREAFREQLRAGSLDLHLLRGLIDRILVPSDPGEQLLLEAGGSTHPIGVLRPRGRWG